MTKPGGDPIAALAHELMVTNNRVDGLTDIVGEVAAGLQSLTTQSAGGKGPPWWPDLKDSDKAVAWRILVDWLRGTLLPHQQHLDCVLAAQGPSRLAPKPPAGQDHHPVKEQLRSDLSPSHRRIAPDRRQQRPPARSTQLGPPDPPARVQAVWPTPEATQPLDPRGRLLAGPLP